jgi:orotidine-5'-phosphate decarboxylase
MVDPRVIVALDYAQAGDALSFARKVSPSQCRLKVGFELFVSAGPALVQELVEAGFGVFLDLKFHDIPNTVAAACRSAADLGVWMINVHAAGGRAMLEAAREAVDAGGERPLLIAVTVLTSLADRDLAEVGVPRAVGDQVEQLSALTADCGLDGVVCSAHEAARLRALHGPEFLLVTPGIRPSGSARGDQKRVMTPEEAVSAGSTHLVIGRPITQSEDPASTLDVINTALEALTGG